MTAASPIIRALRLEDADSVGAVHVRAWLAAYRGVMPDAYLDGLTIADRAARWKQMLSNPPRRRGARLGAEVEGRVVGFILVGPMDGDAVSTIGEVYAINVDPDRWGSGIGHVLFDAGVAVLRDERFAESILWVAPANARARRFYEIAGWRHDGGSRRHELLGVEVDEIRYRCVLA